jgi:DNA-directed RNA polymerase subunit RPC12/RpoP
MPVKYHCARCGRRFVDWGAEKLGFKCPDCEDEELVRMGASEDRPAKKASLKRGARKAVPAAPVELEEEYVGGEGAVDEGDEETPIDDESAEEDEEALLVAEDEEGTAFVRSPAELIPSDSDEDEVTLDVGEDLGFGDVAPSISEETFDDSDEESFD